MADAASWGQGQHPGEDKAMQDYDDTGRRRLGAQAEEDDWPQGGDARRRAVARRDAGVRQTRRISTWTAAALVAGVAASAGYFAHAVVTPGVSTNGSSVSSTTGTVGTTGHKPSLTHPVVTSGGSGVTAGTAGGSPGSGGGTVTWRDN
jgi:hypothetical protein